MRINSSLKLFDSIENQETYAHEMLFYLCKVNPLSKSSKSKNTVTSIQCFFKSIFLGKEYVIGFSGKC